MELTTKTIYQKTAGHAKAVDTKNYKILKNKNTLGHYFSNC